MFGHEIPSPLVRTVAVFALAGEIAVHAVLTPDHLREVPYIGMLFLVTSIVLTAVAVGIVVAPRSDLVWYSGAAVCGGAVLGFVASRTLGLPDFHEAWTSDSGLGLVVLPIGVLFVLCALWGRPAGRLDWTWP